LFFFLDLAASDVAADLLVSAFEMLARTMAFI
jgi:hypothetical protein